MAQNFDSESKVQNDAVINHLLGLQFMYKHFIAQDIPKLAEQRAMQLCWKAAAA